MFGSSLLWIAAAAWRHKSGQISAVSLQLRIESITNGKLMQPLSPQNCQACTDRPSLPSVGLALSLLVPVFHKKGGRDNQDRLLKQNEICLYPYQRSEVLTIPPCIDRFKALTSSSFRLSLSCNSSSLQKYFKRIGV